MGFLPSAGARLPQLRSATLASPAPLAMLVDPTAALASLGDDEWSVFAVLSVAGAVGYRLGLQGVGRTLSGPICAMALTFGAASCGVLPPASPMVGAAQLLAVRMATPLLLLGANLRAIARRASTLLPAFLLGTFGSLLGSTLAAVALRPALTAAMGPAGLKVVCALAAKNVSPACSNLPRGGTSPQPAARPVADRAGPFPRRLAAGSTLSPSAPRSPSRPCPVRATRDRPALRSSARHRYLPLPTVTYRYLPLPTVRETSTLVGPPPMVPQQFPPGGSCAGAL